MVHTRARFVLALGLLLVATSLSAAPTADRLIADADKQLEAYRHADALKLYEQARPQVTGAQAVHVQYQIAYCLQRQYKNDPAIKAFEDLLALPGLTPAMQGQAYLGIGECQHMARRFDKALEAYAQVEKVPGVSSDTCAQARLRSGSAYSKLGQPDKALAALESVLEKEVDNAGTHQQALFSAGSMLQDQQRYRDAIPYYERALKVLRAGGAAEFARNGLIECRTACEADPAFFFAPYVSLVSPTEATLFWVSLGATAPTGHVVVKAGDQTIEADAVAVKLADREAWRQTVKLTGLKPYTLYSYEAACSGDTAKGVFHTARDKAGTIHFVVIGDTQTGWEHHTKLGPLIAAEKPDFVLHLGDCVDKGQSWDQWKVQMFDPGKPYLSEAPVWVARGNHDGGPYFPIIFGREKQPFISFTFGDLHVMILESTFMMGKESGKKQLAWLEDELKSNTSLWTIVGMHHCLFHTANGDLLVGQDTFRPLVERYSPDLVLNGHYHKYSRQLPFGTPGQKPLINIVSGGAGGGNGTFSTLSPLVDKSYESFHYCVYTIDGNRLDMTAKDISGKVIDTMTLIKTDGKFQLEVMAKAVDPQVARAIRMVYNDLKYPNYARRDLTGTLVTSSGAPGSQVVLDRNILDTAKLPAGTHLVIDQAPGCTWTVPHQTLDLSKGELTVTASPPSSAGAGDLAKLPPLSLALNVELNGRLYMPWTFEVTLHAPESAPAQAKAQ